MSEIHEMPAQEPPRFCESAPLDPMPGESGPAYEGLLCYVEAGKGKRSVKAIAEELGGSEHTYAEWCTKFQWRARRRAYFALLARKRVQEASALDAQNGCEARAQLKDSTDHKLAEVNNRVADAAGALLEHKLKHHAEDFKIIDILRMLRLADQNGRTKRATTPPSVLDAGWRKEVLTIAAFARQQTKLQASSSTPENNSQASGPSPGTESTGSNSSNQTPKANN